MPMSLSTRKDNPRDTLVGWSDWGRGDVFLIGHRRMPEIEIGREVAEQGRADLFQLLDLGGRQLLKEVSADALDVGGRGGANHVHPRVGEDGGPAPAVRGAV